jgi:hypothetical protein
VTPRERDIQESSTWVRLQLHQRLWLPKQGQVRSPLVVAKIEVGFAAIIQHKRFSVLKGTHCARIGV